MAAFRKLFLDGLGGSVCCFLLRKACIANIRRRSFQIFNSVVVRSLMSSNRHQVTIFIAGCIFMIFWCGPIFPGCGQRSKVILDHIHDPPKYPPQK